MCPRIRVARVIARLNVGGPAIQATLLTSRLDPSRFESRLYAGDVGPGEVEMSELIRAEGVSPVRIAGLGREVRPGADTRALASLMLEFRRFRPDIVHTHTAKAGALGRIAAALSGVPVTVHTFHGNVFRGYFAPWKSAAIVNAERLLALLSTCVVAISEQQQRELVDRFRVVSAARVRLIPLGIDLSRARAATVPPTEVRALLGVPEGAPFVAWVGRLTEIKNPGLAVEVAERLHQVRPRPVMVFVGGGNLEGPLRSLTTERQLADWVRFAGWHDDIASILGAADALLLTSENEGTPVAVIEALAAGVPVVATDVGGVEDMVQHGLYGLTAPCGDADGLAESLLRVLSDEGLRVRTRIEGPHYAESRWGVARLVADVEDLYSRLLRASRKGSSRS